MHAVKRDATMHGNMLDLHYKNNITINSILFNNIYIVANTQKLEETTLTIAEL